MILADNCVDAVLDAIGELPQDPFPFQAVVVRDDPGEHEWVYVDLPLAELLARGLRVEHPHVDETDVRTVTAHLLAMAQAIHERVPLTAAGIGHELQGPHILDALNGGEPSFVLLHG